MFRGGDNLMLNFNVQRSTGSSIPQIIIVMQFVESAHFHLI